MNTTYTKTSTEGAANSQSEQIKPTLADVVLGKSEVPGTQRPFYVMPLNNRSTEWYSSPVVARVAAQSMAAQSSGHVINRMK